MAVAPSAVSAQADRNDFQSKGGTAPPEKEWPGAGARYWALFVIVFATFVTFFDQVVFGMLAQRIKVDFGLTDSQLGFLAGPASIICYFFVGIPLARLADIWPRKFVLAGGVAVVGFVTALGGFAQTFIQFVGSRVFLAAGGSAHAPSSYSLIADAFPPKIITRAFALLQFGFIGGTTLGPLIGGYLIVMTSGWEPTYLGGLRVFGWQWILVWISLPAFVAALLFLTVREPKRHAPRGGRGAAARECVFRAHDCHLHGLGCREGDFCQSQGLLPAVRRVGAERSRKLRAAVLASSVHDPDFRMG